ncbi:hypothetical protein GYMLUDRAFT_210955 [Collybiopsis luxurians FD-317 M1]|nr:hypothetical protein GYMLUDRAFT_210955 [Collybiopsis luxurians FD-317 M1]
MSTSFPFLSLPLELREIIYKLFLSELKHDIPNNRQPINQHFAVLHVCRQISSEAEHLAGFRSYVSLSHEAQISAFRRNISEEQALRITAVDVASDPRLVHAPGHVMSELFGVLSKLASLRKLRVFECNRSRPIKDFILGARFTLQFEKALFPYGEAPHLDSYELYLSPFKSSTRIFQVISSEFCQTLRLSGDCGLQQGTTLPRLSDLSINGVTGHYLDQHMEEYFSQSPLKTFQYKQGDKSGARFELRDHHLGSLAFGSASKLNKISLLGCSRLSSSTLSTCLINLKSLRYLALSFVSVHELQSNFINALPLSLMVLKLAVTNARYAIPRLQEEHRLCESVEELVIMRKPAFEKVCIHFRAEVMTRGVESKWIGIAAAHKFVLELGPWDEDEIF